MSKYLVPANNSLYVDGQGLTRVAKSMLNLRPNLVQTTAKVAGVPTQVTRGLNVGYSMPIWTTPAGADEELHWRLRIPGRWDRVTDPEFGMCVTLMNIGGEDVGDKFKFQMDWQTTAAGDEMGTTTSNTTSEQTVLTGRNAQYDTYFVFFMFNADDANNPLIAGNMLQAKIKRIDASANECTGEIAIWDWSSIWPVDRMFGAWVLNQNAA